MFKHTGIAANIALGFGAIIALLLFLLSFAYMNFERLSSANGWDRHTLKVLLETRQIATSILQIQSATRGYMLTGNDTLPAGIPAEDMTARRHLSAALALTADNRAQQQRLGQLGSMMEQWMTGVIEPLLARRKAAKAFSVVATEIRRLADQTSVSTWDIEQMLKEMQSAVSASVMGMDKFSEEIRRSVGEVRQVGDQLSAVMDQVQQLAPQFEQVLQGMQSQAVGAEQISHTMMQLTDTTQQTVDSLKATSAAVHQLQYAATDLQLSVSTFSVQAASR